jgi:hypothetical protein
VSEGGDEELSNFNYNKHTRQKKKEGKTSCHCMHLIVNLIGLIINISYQTKKKNQSQITNSKKNKNKNETQKLTLFDEKVKIPL